MTREPLPPRRDGVSVDLVHALADGNSVRFTATYGFDASRQVREVFCLSQKSGTDLQSLLHQCCIAISLGLQHGATMEELRHTLGEDNPALQPRSIIGAIVRAGAVLDAERPTATIHEFPEPAREGDCPTDPSSDAQSMCGGLTVLRGPQSRASAIPDVDVSVGVTAGETAPSFEPAVIEAAVAQARPADDFEIPEFLRRKPERQYADMTGIVE